MRFFLIAAALSISSVSAQQLSSTATTNLDEAISQARKWYASLPPDEREQVDARYKEYEAFMKKHSDEMNERMNKVDMNERMIYVDRQNELMKKRRGIIKP